MSYYRFLRCVVEINDVEQVAIVRFADGQYVRRGCHAQYHMADEQGYGRDLWTQVVDETIAFAWLAHQEGLAWSGTQWKEAHPGAHVHIGPAAEIVERETVYRFLIALDKEAPRPWEGMLALVE